VEETTEQPFKVWPENWEAVVMFLRLLTQWRAGPRGLIGLDYRAAEWLFSLYQVTQPRELLEDLRIMELALLDEISGRAA
jgi:hypothetical protein